MSNSKEISILEWSIVLLLASPCWLLSGCDVPEDAVADDIEDSEEQSEEYIDNPGEIKTDILRLGNKWRLSAIGDAHADDDWLRLFNIYNTDYYGGFAAHRLWTLSGALSGSDINLKTDISTLAAPLDQLLSLRGVKFRWKHDPDGRQIGLIAQEVESVFPELVEVGPDGFKGIEYDGLSAVMIEAMKQQQAQIESLQNELLDLRADLRDMSTRNVSRFR